MNKKQDILHGYKPILMGLLLMALVYAAIAATRTFGADIKLEFVALAGLILSWLPVLWGTMILRKVRPEFEYGFIISIVSLVAIFAQTGLGIKNFLNNMEEQTFIQFDVMFFGFVALLGMVILYRLLMQGISRMSGEPSEKKATEEWKTVWLVGLIIIAAGTLFIPVSALFPNVIEKILGGLVILIVVGTELYWYRYIKRRAQAFLKRGRGQL